MEAWSRWAVHAHKRMINKDDDEDDDEEGAGGEVVFFFLDSTVRKNIHNNLYKKQDYLFYTIIV
jgi:hypothetical protein